MREEGSASFAGHPFSLLGVQQRKGYDDMTNLVSIIFRYALYLGMAGQLVGATLNMRREAAKAGQRGLVSLKTLNSGLSGNSK